MKRYPIKKSCPLNQLLDPTQMGWTMSILDDQAAQVSPALCFHLSAGSASHLFIQQGLI